MGARRVAPAAIVVGQSIVGRAKIGGGDEDGRATGVAPLRIISALELETGTAAKPIVEQSRAQRCSVYSIPLAV